MIVHPANWNYVYSCPTLDEIESVLQEAVWAIGVNNLCLSGGIDSSLTLHFMSLVHSNINCFTIASHEEHPDVHYSRMVAALYNANHYVFIPTQEEILKEQQVGDNMGDAGVRLLFHFISKYTNEVIATDCIDELACGYYAHERQPTAATYWSFIKDLELGHLKPLDQNSGDVKVFLPYATKEVVDLFNRIPLDQKTANGRKAHIVAIASKYLPPDIINRRKIGFCSALDPTKNIGSSY